MHIFISYSVFFFGLFLSICIANNNNATQVNLVKCKDPSCIYSGDFRPNGTLHSQEWNYYAVDLSTIKLSHGVGIEIDISELVSLSDLAANVTVYLKRADLPTPEDHDDSQFVACFGKCTYIFPYSVGYCNPSSTFWYVGITNAGNNSLSYVLDTQINDSGGEPLGCNTVNNINNYVRKLLISIGSVVGFLLLVGIVATVYFCRRNKMLEGYVPVPSKEGTVYHRNVTPGMSPAYRATFKSPPAERIVL